MAMRLVLYDGGLWQSLLPLTYLKAVGALRLGIGTVAEAWQRALNADSVAFATQEHLHSLYPTDGTDAGECLYLLGGLLPNSELLLAVQNLPTGSVLCHNGHILAIRSQQPIPMDANGCPKLGAGEPCSMEGENPSPLAFKEFTGEVDIIEHPWDLFLRCGQAIAWDYNALTAGQSSQPISHTVRVIGQGGVFLAPGAVAECCTLNTTEGPIYLGAGSEIMEGCHIRGPLALGEGATLKMGAKIYGPTSIGPHCKVGGEVSNCVVMEYSNKGHDGFIGNSVLGSWCNLGADTNSSNLKNTYDKVKVWSIAESRFVQTGLQFCGLLMGDHSKTGINTMLNTGTVVGAFCNVYGDGFPRVWIPSFSWGGAQGLSEHPLARALGTAEAMMARRHVQLSPPIRQAVEAVHRLTENERPHGQLNKA